MEIPECPVCLQSYDGEDAIPRVLGCGHTACESCLTHLPQKYPNTVRCPACIQLVKYPPQGPSGLPKNIELLRLQPNSQKSHKQSRNDAVVPEEHLECQFLPHLWSDEFYECWKDWILPKESVLREAGAEEEPFPGRYKEDESKTLSLVRVCALSTDSDDTVFKFSYVATVMRCLNDMREEVRAELLLLLGACLKSRQICRIHGLWGDLEDGFLYIVSERLQKLNNFEDGLVRESNDGLCGFAMMFMEICEGVIELNLKGVIAGCLGLSCFKFDEFGHVCVDLSEVLVMGRARNGIIEAALEENGVVWQHMVAFFTYLSKTELFLSPEILYELIGINPDCVQHSVGRGSDVWSIGCVFVRLLIGRKFSEELMDYIHHGVPEASDENGLSCMDHYERWAEKIRSLMESKFGTDFASLQQILCQCLNFDPASRPPVTDLWNCIRELIIGLQFGSMFRLQGIVYDKTKKGYCLVLGDLCTLPKEKVGLNDKEDELPGTKDGADFYQPEHKEIVEAISEGNIKIKIIQGHMDCITGLAVGGGFLFSSSYDKSIQVWSLQDFSHVHTFKGHEHKVMALVYVDGEQPLCISGDSGGGVFLWNISIPLGQEPSKKWYEEKDWRYSGIHCLTTAGNGYLYTGSGDTSVKAWSLKDSTLSCTMTGHKSAVSTLAVCDGVLYSGSWDGTIRLWSLTDHSLLTVLGEDMPGKLNSVLSITSDNHMLISTHENGSIKVWRNDVFMKSTQIHNGAIFAVRMEGKWLFTGGWDKTINVQELSGNEFQVDYIPVGSIPCGSVVTSLLYWQGRVFVGGADRTIKVYYYGKQLRLDEVNHNGMYQVAGEQMNMFS
ncbi:hypothetical protein HS088_TW04G01022 [Tripterygium wilfordii]|uniref:Uncharacterized protein n=1 Tax=Tripterygium wilfordii TaxID=458696 RepID=A0A7J7DRY4_TRIWF|nr:uncharacterized protein LOC119997243 [Tripterygium wilfordii]KAF5749061.1 hypothetical protein HS088_TW04G01022 [Tripterygium wilfordii]